jgi:hypothetical protein
MRFTPPPSKGDMKTRGVPPGVHVVVSALVGMIWRSNTNAACARKLPVPSGVASELIGSPASTDCRDQHSCRGTGEHAASRAVDENRYARSNERPLRQFLDASSFSGRYADRKYSHCTNSAARPKFEAPIAFDHFNCSERTLCASAIRATKRLTSWTGSLPRLRRSHRPGVHSCLLCSLQRVPR